MRNIFVVLFALVLIVSCNDGDIITVDLDFEGDLVLCDNNTDDFTIYDLRNDPSESLSIIIPRTPDDIVPYFNPTPIDDPNEISIGTNARLIYRTYNRDIANTPPSNQELCNAVIAPDLIIQENYEANGGTVEVTVAIVDDDNDGIPSELEGRGNADENGNFPDAEDFDGDGIPNYLDQDDDDDNVQTRFEIDTENLDGDDDPTTNFLDTDGDGEPDYLDMDDDNDGTMTINEDEDGDFNPRDDFSIDSNGISIAHYLNNEADTAYESPGKLPTNEFTRVITSQWIIKDFDLEILSQDLIDFGTLVNTVTVITEFED